MNSIPQITRAELDAAIHGSVLTELRVRGDRIVDLECDLEALRETLRASVELNHRLTGENARLRICLRRHLHEAYGIVVERGAAA